MLKKSKLKLLVYLVLIFAMGAGAWAVIASQSQESASPKLESTVRAETPARTRTEITYTAHAGFTSLEQLQNEADNVVVKETEYGKYVDVIEGHQGGVDGKYWSFYINGELSQVGADTYVQEGGEQIAWKFQRL